MFVCLALISSLLVGTASKLVNAADFDIDAALSFELGETNGFPTGWGGGSNESLSLDRSMHRRGQASGRIVRTAESAGKFSSLTYRLPANVQGNRITFKAWVRSSDVEGYFGLWMRQDRRRGEPLDFAHNYQDRLSGDFEWREVSISTELQTNAQTINFGVMLEGPGAVWVDDVEITIDDVSYTKAPPRERELAPWLKDTEFDEGSLVSDFSPDRHSVENLATLIEVWGFAKYHHPAVANGQVNVDYELFRVLPDVMAADDADKLNSVLARWIEDLGPPEACSPCASLPDDLYLGPPVDWIEDSDRFGRELSQSLVSLHRNRPTSGDHVFVDVKPGAGQPDFSSEAQYARQDETDAGFRLLALARLWNIIRYWYPYRDLVDTPWEDVLREFIPRLSVELAHDEYARELFGLVVEIRDTHANLWSALQYRPPAGECAIDVSLRFVGKQAVVWDVTPESGQHLEIGDVLRSVDGRAVDDLISDWSPLYAASNEPTRLRDIARSLPIGPCEGSVLEIERKIDGRLEAIETTVPRSSTRAEALSSPPTHDRGGPTYQDLSDEVAYLKLSSIEMDDIEPAITAAQGKKGLIVDIRNYPSAFVVFELGGRFIDKDESFARTVGVDLANPGALVWREPISMAPKKPTFTGKVAILVDEISQSQSEYTAMALRVSDRAIVVGSTTAGADGNITQIKLPGEFTMVISGIGVFYPDKAPTQRIGILPDVVALPTVEGIRQGRDEVVEAALRYILGDMASEEQVREIAARPE